MCEDHEQLVEEARLLLAMLDGHHLAYWQSRYDDELTRVEMMQEAGGAAIGALFTWCALPRWLPHCASITVLAGTGTSAPALLWHSRCSSSHLFRAWTTATKVHCPLFPRLHL